MWIKFLLGLSLSLPAFAYNLTQDFTNGFYWASLPVRIAVVDSDAVRKSKLERLAQAAVAEWHNRTGLSLWSFNSGTNNIIRWSTNFASETRMDAASVLAVAIRYTDGPYFAKAEIIINGTHPALYEKFYDQMKESEVKTTITHELGHTMGLDHSNNMLAVMAPTLQSPYNGLHNDDVMGMNDAHAQTENRQLTGYISPLAYTQSSSGNALSCGTVGAAATGTNPSAFFSLGLGMLIGFVRKIMKWFKSRL